MWECEKKRERGGERAKEREGGEREIRNREAVNKMLIYISKRERERPRERERDN